jgi:uncharacterized protein YjbJ (UPF0337 family)
VFGFLPAGTKLGVLNVKGVILMGDKTDRATGQVKEKAGEATGNRSLAESGRREQIKGDVKSGGKKLKDAAKKL